METLSLNKQQVVDLYNNQKNISKNERVLLELATWKAARKNNFNGFKSSDLEATKINISDIDTCKSYLDLLIY